MQEFIILQKMTFCIQKVKRQNDQKKYIARVVQYKHLQSKYLNQLAQQISLQKQFKHTYALKYQQKIIQKPQQRLTILYDDVQQAKGILQFVQSNPNQEIIWKLLFQLLILLKDLHRVKGFGGLHGNINPANILVTNNAQIKVGPFGYLLRGSQQKILLNQFISPQQKQGQVLSPKSDVYSLGMLLKSAIVSTNLNISSQMTRVIKWCTFKLAKDRPSLIQLCQLPDISFLARQKRLYQNKIIIKNRFLELQQREDKLHKTTFHKL